MDGRPFGRGRGTRPKPTQLELGSENVDVPGSAPTTPVTDVAQRVETMQVEEPAPVRPMGRGRAARGRAVPSRGMEEPVSPGKPPTVQTELVSGNVYLQDPDMTAAPAGKQQEQGTSAAGGDAAGPCETELGEASRSAPEATGSVQVAEDQAGVPTVGGSESFTAVHLVKQGKEPVVKHGDKGDRIHLATNFIRVKLADNKGMFEYRVEFIPTTQAMDLRKKAVKACADRLGTTRTFDGQTLYLPFTLPNEVTEVSVDNPNEPGEKMRVIFKFIKKQSMLDSVHFYNVLLTRIHRELGYVEMGRNFFNYRATHEIPQHKLEIWPGTVTRIDEVEGGLMLCLDASHRVLRTDTVLDMWNHIKGNPRGNLNAHKEQFKEALIGKLILTRYNRQCHRVDDVTFDLNPNSTFDRKGVQIKYMDYYKQQYNLNITDQCQPLLISKPKERRSDKPGQERLIILIPELCRMSGLSDEQISNFTVMKDVAQFTRITPQKRLQAMTEFISNVKREQKTSDILSEWGLEFESGLLQVDGRIIAAPNLAFNSQFTLKPGKPDFSREATSNACYRPVALARYVILCTKNDKAKADQLVRMYKQVCSQLGIQHGPPGVVVTVNGNTANDFRQALHEYADPDTVQLVVVILPAPRDDLYGAVKKYCVAEKAMPSQVILARTLNNEKRLKSVMQKVALQINCKLGGALWSLKIPLPQKIMFVGIDVYHDPKRKNPSVTAFVASLDTACTSYFSKVIVQKPHQEQVDSLCGVFVRALEEYRDTNQGKFPDRVIVFRDGVSDGQWEFVKETEIRQLKEAFKIVDMESHPLFTFVVVQKKINERFFALKGNMADNPPPGSVLDHSVSRRYYYDFFIVSQLVRQGTVSPTHFVVLEDTSDIKPDLIQKFSFATTFMYFNWPGTIRVPAMCQYAHKLAYLVGQHVKTNPADSHATTLYYL